MSSIRVLVAEDEPLFRDMLRIALSAQPALEVVGVAADGETALKLGRELTPDVVLLDIELGRGPNGIQVAQSLRKELSQIGIVLLSNHRDKQYLASLRQNDAGGWSYLLKRSVSDASTLARAIEGVYRGLMVLDPAVALGLHPREGSRLARLTPRQLEVLGLMAQGYNNAAIAEQLVLSEKSVENYINAIYQELNIFRTEEPVHPRVRAVLAYLQESGER